MRELIKEEYKETSGGIVVTSCSQMSPVNSFAGCIVEDFYDSAVELTIDLFEWFDDITSDDPDGGG